MVIIASAVMLMISTMITSHDYDYDTIAILITNNSENSEQAKL